MSQLLKVQVQDEEGNIYYIHTSADVVFCEDGATVETKLGQKIDKSSIVQNATTASSEKIPSAAVAKILQEQITELNTKINNLRSWYAEYYVKQGYGARVKYKDGSTPMPDGVYLVDAVITGTSMDTYTRYLVRIRQPAGIYKITGLQTVSSPDELQVNLYWGGENTDQLSIMTNNDTQYYTVTLGITQIA